MSKKLKLTNLSETEMKKVLIVFVMLLFVLSSYIYSGRKEKKNLKQSISEIVLKNVDGTTSKLSDFGGKKLIVVFSSPKCIHCVDEIPTLKKLMKEYKDKLNIVSVLMIPVDKNVMKFLKNEKLPYPVFKRNEEFEELIGGVGYYPTIYFLDKNMKVKKRTEGYKEYDYIEYIIEKKLN